MPLAIFLLSAAALAYEILLMRLLSIVQWHHFAWMVLSLALLGFGASGTFLTFARAVLVARFRSAFATLTILFSLSTIGCFSLAQRIRFNALEILWNPRELLALVGIYLLLAIPFFFAATAIGLTFARSREDVPSLYRADLLGAGFGALGAIAVLFVLTPDKAVQLTTLAGLVSSAVALPRRFAVSIVAAGLLVIAIWPSSWLEPRVSEFKELSAALRIPGARVIERRTSPLGTLAIVENKTVPLRVAPGLSLNFTGDLPEQRAIFTDGGAPTVITRFPADVSFLDSLTSAAPYHLLQRPRVVVLGSGGGMEVLNAFAHDARSVDAVELNRDVVRYLKQDARDFSGNLYGRARVHVEDARGFIERLDGERDLIQISLLDAFGVSAAGLHGLNESYLYTVESFQQMLRRVERGGMLAITRWLNLPPRDTLKLIAILIEAMEREGIDDPSRRLAILRSWKTITILVKNGAFTPRDLETLHKFADERSFDIDYLAGTFATNRYNDIGDSALDVEVATLLSRRRADFIERYKFEIEPATDDRPWFFHFFRWTYFRELVTLRGRGGGFLLELGYLVVVVTLVQAIAAGFILIVAPLMFMRTRRSRNGTFVIYFTALGLGFLFIEIAAIQKLTLFLSHPFHAAAVALGSFLIFAGIGSGASQRLIGWLGSIRNVAIAIAVLALGALALPTALAFPLGVKVILAIVAIAPIAILMGVPFPAGLSRVDETSIPLAWGINGCASVTSAPLAMLIAIHAGFSGVLIAAASLYAIAAFAIQERSSSGVAF